MFERVNDNGASVNLGKSITKQSATVNKHGNYQYGKRAFKSSVFLYIGIWLAVTFAVALTLNLVWHYYFAYSGIKFNVLTESSENFVSFPLLITLFASLPIALICGCVLAFTQNKSSIECKVCGVFYSAAVGGILSIPITLCSEMNPIIVPAAILIVALSLVISCLFGSLVKSTRTLYQLAIFFGALAVVTPIIILVSYLLTSRLGFTPSNGDNSTLFIIVDVFIALYLIIDISIEVARIEQIADACPGDDNIALMCAVIIYSDLVRLLLVALRIILEAAITSSKKK